MWPDKGEETELDRGGPASLAGPAGLEVPQFLLSVVKGPAAGLEWRSATDVCALGSHPSNDLVLDDRTVSRFHCEIHLGPDGAKVRDLDSRNGTLVDGVRVVEGWLRDESVLRLGQSEVAFRLAATINPVPLSEATNFGGLLGRSVAMRASFALLERAAPTSATVLLEGETGTGKEEAAHALHASSERREGPFVVVDCSAIQENLLESELFGHEKGSFTGAVARRVGAFEAAHGGTVFLDEVGELLPDIQPKLLRVLERRTIRRLGATEELSVDVRVVAATNRDLRAEVNAGRFREDLYFRLAVMKVELPPLRRLHDDVSLLVEHFLDALGAPEGVRQQLLDPVALTQLSSAAWPGNVRQLRNYVEQAMVLETRPPIGDHARGASEEPPPIDPRVSYQESRRRVLDDFELRYLEALLRHCRDNVSLAARTAGLSRVYLYKLLRRHGLKG